MSFSLKFLPAQYYKGKECYVAYYVENPFTHTLVRKKVKLNRIRSASERRRYASTIIDEINRRLYDGWNPFLEQAAPNAVSFREAIADFLKAKSKNLRPDSMRTYTSWCASFSEWLDSRGMLDSCCALFTPEQARRYMAHIEDREGVSNKTYNNNLRFMRTLFIHLQKRECVGGNPFERIDMKRCDGKTRAIIPSGDRARIRDYFTARGMDGYVCVMMFCYRLLVRPKEIMMLRVSDIDFAEGLVHVRPEVSKNHHGRTLAAPEEIMAYLRPLSVCDGRMYLFSDNYLPGYTPKGTRDVGRTWSRMRSELKLPASYQFYSLKDTGITEMLEAGVPAKYVKELADHHSLEMTERYTHRSEAKKILEWNRLEF